MMLTVKRDIQAKAGTLGILYLDGAHAGYTLELPVRDGLPGSAIPCGTYKVTMYDSPHFGRQMPLLVGVPGRSEIEIHWGNDVTDTRGCILVGKSRWVNSLEIFQTRNKFDELFPVILGAVEHEGCSITVEDGVASDHEAVSDAAAGEL